MAFSIEIVGGETQLNSVFSDILQASASKSNVRSACDKLAEDIRKRFQSRGKPYYDRASEKVSLDEVSDGFIIGLSQVGIGIHAFGTQGYLGRPLKATGRISEVTGKPIKNLAIPSEKAPRKQDEKLSIYGAGFREGDLKFIPSRKGGNLTGFLALNDKLSKSGQKSANKLKKKGVKPSEILYTLIKEANIRPTPNLLPSETEINSFLIKNIIDSYIGYTSSYRHS